MVSDKEIREAAAKAGGLNPCSNGIWSLTDQNEGKEDSFDRLNPCSNGIWSLTKGESIMNDWTFMS